MRNTTRMDVASGFMKLNKPRYIKPAICEEKRYEKCVVLACTLKDAQVPACQFGEIGAVS